MYSDVSQTLEHLFPELKESEDERMLREIKRYIKEQGGKPTGLPNGCVAVNDMLAWLEKQGKDSQVICPTFTFDDILALQCSMETAKKVQEDKELYEQLHSLHNRLHDAYWLEKQRGQKHVESKFKVGDWVVSPNGVYWHIDAIRDGRYQVSSDSGEGAEWPLDTNIYHRFTIQDAKDGDVLATDSCLYIFKYTNNKAIIQFHCTCPINGKSYKWCFLSDGSYLDICIDANIHPATKEQRDILFKKMREAGYEWDAEKKELKKIEQKTAEWSEEDELSCFESALFTAFSDAWQEYLNGEEVNVKQWAKEHSKEILEAAKEQLQKLKG